MFEHLMVMQEKNDKMIDFIKRLKQCIKWFLQLELNYVEEQGKIKKLLELAEKKCNDTGKLVLCLINGDLFFYL